MMCERCIENYTDREPCLDCSYGDEYCAECDYMRSVINDSYNRVQRVRRWFSELEKLETPSTDEAVEELPF